MSKKSFYLTAAIPYVNGKPHCGHALEFIQGDVIARYKKLQEFEVKYISGSDENGLKIVKAAEEQGLTPQGLADKNTQSFLELIEKLNVDINTWRRGSDKKLHWPGTYKLWALCKENDDIYKKTYGGYYCVGCEDFYNKEDLIDGKCPEHLKELEWVEEENYYFRLSKYQSEISDLIENDKVAIVPSLRKKEVMEFIRQGLTDFSISRTKERSKGWGIPVENDPEQTIYTWFDALNVYQTGVGFGTNDDEWKKWWPADVHVIGKGILKFHAIYWLGMLLSAKLPLPRSIFVHGYITSGGQKMSKSLGNVVDPFELVDKYGTDALRFYLLKVVPPSQDGDLTDDKLSEVYIGELQNGLGNLVSRVAAMVEKESVEFVATEEQKVSKEIITYLDKFEFNRAVEWIWERIRECDGIINQKQVWKLEGEEKKVVLVDLVERIRQIAFDLQPFLPETAEKILKQYGEEKITKEEGLFPRLSK